MADGPRTREYLLPAACGIGAVMLVASTFMVRFRIDVEGTIVERVKGGSSVAVALLLLGLLALLSLLATIGTGGRAPALAVALAGAIALALVLIGDLPDVNRKGTLSNFVTGKAVPGPGFWFELVGALVVAVCGVAIATMRSRDLYALSLRRRGPEPTGHE
jgi:hypothetical protein